jgi:hypothetical protein
MLRLLIKDITVEKQHGARHALLHIRWQGGACGDVRVDLPLPRAKRSATRSRSLRAFATWPAL